MFIVAGIYAISSFYAVQLIQCIESLLARFNITNDKFITRYEFKDSCSVCSNNTCKRHKLLPHSTKIKVPKDFDYASEQVITSYCYNIKKKIIVLCELYHSYFIYILIIYKNIFVAFRRGAADLRPLMVL